MSRFRKKAGIRAAATALFLAFAATAAAGIDPAYVAMLAKDAPRAADHPLTGRYKGASLLAQSVKAFDERALPAGPAEGKSYQKDKHFSKIETVRGKVTRSVYVAPPDRSSLEIYENHRDILKEKGFEPVFECAKENCGQSFPSLKYNWQDKTTQVESEGYEHTRSLAVQAVFDRVQDPRYGLFRKTTPEGDAYVALYAALNAGGTHGDFSQLLNDRAAILVETVEPRSMEKRMVTQSAEEIGGKITAEGRATFYNILFDFDKAELKPESAPQIAEMARFLKENPQARIFIIGHTDNKGGLDYNLQLSGKRAQAVAKALSAQYGVDAKRLAARGLGPLAPVATNRTEEGQAKNRRVEMVEQ